MMGVSEMTIQEVTIWHSENNRKTKLEMIINHEGKKKLIWKKVF